MRPADLLPTSGKHCHHAVVEPIQQTRRRCASQLFEEIVHHTLIQIHSSSYTHLGEKPLITFINEGQGRLPRIYHRTQIFWRLNMRHTLIALSMVGFVLGSLPSVALAHARLLSSTPAANATASRVTSIRLAFNERLIASTVRVELTMTGMPGMQDHAPMKVEFSSQMGRDGKSMMLMPKRMLAPGTYKVKWSAAGADTHRLGSEFSFTVR